MSAVTMGQKVVAPSLRSLLSLSAMSAQDVLTHVDPITDGKITVICKVANSTRIGN